MKMRLNFSLLRGRAGSLSSNALLLGVVGFLVLAANLSFHAQVLKAYPLSTANALPLLTLPVGLGCVTLLILAPFCFGRATRYVLGLILLLSSLAAYFMDSYGVVISDEMLQNALQTNLAEARDLLNLKLLGYLVLLGILPALALFRLPLSWRGWRAELLARLKLAGVALALLVAMIAAFGSFYASFLREHKPIRSFANPGGYLAAAVKLAKGREAPRAPTDVEPIGTDAHVRSGDTERELVVLVVGETARADHFSLNGYGRETNPELQREKVISFTDFWACGTSTAVSVPCMFSLLGSERYDGGKAQQQQNLLDVLQRTGAYMLWLDNNSDSKGVALRVPYESYRTPDKNRQCDEECRDEGMLDRLQEVIDAHPSGDIVIVLHQMGNHGPAYYKRYPPTYERFGPTCKSNDLSQCSDAEIINAYDNAIVYTDHFLARVIGILKRNDAKFETAMFYLSDHGESLGEKGTYLHGLPKAFAPDAQLHVPAIMWFGDGFDDLDRPALEKKRAQHFTHDHLFHTLLGFLEVESAVYRPELDMLQGAHLPERK